MHPDPKIAGVLAKLDAGAVAATAAAPPLPSSAAPSDPATDHLAFENEAYRYAADWLAAHVNEIASAKPFALVFSRSIPHDMAMLATAGHSTAKKYDAFRNQKMNDVTGAVIFATINFEQAIVLPLQSVIDTQTLFDSIESLACNDRVAAVLEPVHSNLILRKPNGSSRSMIVKQAGHGPLWTVDQLEKGIEAFHHDFTRTPSGVLVQWSSPKNGITGEKLEIRISKYLAYELDRNFVKGSVLAEAETSSGRMDIFIGPSVLDVGTAVLEVKVLRSNSGKKKLSANFNIKWAKKGIVQAQLYRKDKQAAAAYLLCFDAREVDEDIPEVEKFALAGQVTSKRYFMYRATEDLQQALLSASLAAASAAAGAAGSR